MKEPLFTIGALTHTQNSVNAVLIIDRQNEIFNGHFPDHPIVPGASMLQIVKEVLIRAFAQPLRLVTADNIKFLALIEPDKVTDLQLNISYQLLDGNIKINANLAAGEVVCMKLQGLFMGE